MKIKITGNFTKTKEAINKNYPSSYIFNNEKIEVDRLVMGGILHMFVYNDEHYYGDAKYCALEILDD